MTKKPESPVLTGPLSSLLLWPIKDLKVELEYFKALGIFFSINYNKALDETWKDINRKLEKRIKMIKNWEFTLYQKAILINSLIASKIWYAAHTYPLPESFVGSIVKEIYLNFIWNSKKRSYNERRNK